MSYSKILSDKLMGYASSGKIQGDDMVIIVSPDLMNTLQSEATDDNNYYLNYSTVTIWPSETPILRFSGLPIYSTPQLSGLSFFVAGQQIEIEGL